MGRVNEIRGCYNQKRMKRGLLPIPSPTFALRALVTFGRVSLNGDAWRVVQAKGSPALLDDGELSYDRTVAERVLRRVEAVV